MEHTVQRNTKAAVAKSKGDFFGRKNEPAFFGPAYIQPKLSIGAPDDRYEREADGMADKVMRMGDTGILPTAIMPANVQRKCAHCEDEEKLQRKPGTDIVQREPGDKVPSHVSVSDDPDKQYGDRSFLQLRVTVAGPGTNDPNDKQINFGEANLQLIQNGVISPGDFSVDYEDLWKTDYKLTTEWGLGTIVKNLYGVRQRIDTGMLGPVRAGVKKIPLVGSFLSSKIKLDRPDVKNNDWDTWLTNKLALSGLGAATSRDNHAFNEGSGLTFTINIIDTHFDENKIHRKPSSGSHPVNTASAEQSLQSGGQSMDNATRSFMESRFGYDFSNVKIHNDSLAHQSASDINALAYTHGRDIVFGSGQYRPDSNAGKQLLAHELVHVVQQDNKSGLVQKKGCGFTATDEGLWAHQHPGKVFSSGDNAKEPNEFIFWNFCVGDVELRDEHKTALLAEMARWNKLMNATTATRGDLKINITGTASSSGNAALNTLLANGRADKVKDFLVANGIPANIIDTSGSGSAPALANGGTPEDEARNRRVELFLFAPTQTGNITGALVAANVNNLTIGRIAKDPAPVFDVSKNLFARRLLAMKASADVDFTGFQGDRIGMIQFLTFDSRNAQYRSPQGEELTLDFERCFTQLPCRDVADATSLFSFDDETLVLKNTSTQSGKVTMHDAPGTGYPLKYPDKNKGPFVLQRYSWTMGFDLILGIRAASLFMPLQAVAWGLGSTEDVDVKNKKTSGLGPFVVHGNWAPATAAAKKAEVDTAMSGKTCRLLARSIENLPNERPCKPDEIR